MFVKVQGQTEVRVVRKIWQRVVFGLKPLFWQLNSFMVFFNEAFGNGVTAWECLAGFSRTAILIQKAQALTL